MDLTVISEEERVRHHLLFYSQGPIAGYLSGKEARDILLQSNLPLPVLSQIWNLADTSHDNLLDAAEFTSVMHLIQCRLCGIRLPSELAEPLTQPASITSLSEMTEAEEEAYTAVFEELDSSNTSVLEASDVIPLLCNTGLSDEKLALIWRLSDFDQTNKLTREKFCIICHLVRNEQKGCDIGDSVDVFRFIPNKLSPTSAMARKLRIERYERHKAKLLRWKELRKQQCDQEKRRFELYKEKLTLIQNLHTILKSQSEIPLSEDFGRQLADEKKKLLQQEKIFHRVKREHERVRQEAVKLILEDGQMEIERKKVKETEHEINSVLSLTHSRATKDADPFHELHEFRKEERGQQRSRSISSTSSLELPDAYIPFCYNPFSKESIEKLSTPNPADNILDKICDFYHKTTFGAVSLYFHLPEKELHDGISRIDDDFILMWRQRISANGKQACLTSRWGHVTHLEPILEEDSVFTPIPVSLDDELWFSLYFNPPSGTSQNHLVDLHKKLVDLKDELEKLNSKGGRLCFKNSEDYEEDRKETHEQDKRTRIHHYRQRLNVSANRRHTNANCDNAEGPSTSHRAAREYRLKRRSLNLDHQQSLSAGGSGHLSPSSLSPSRSNSTDSLADSSSRSGSTESIASLTGTSPRAVEQISRWRARKLQREALGLPTSPSFSLPSPASPSGQSTQSHLFFPGSSQVTTSAVTNIPSPTVTPRKLPPSGRQTQTKSDTVAAVEQTIPSSPKPVLIPRSLSKSSQSKQLSINTDTPKDIDVCSRLSDHTLHSGNLNSHLNNSPAHDVTVTSYKPKRAKSEREIEESSVKVSDLTPLESINTSTVKQTPKTGYRDITAGENYNNNNTNTVDSARETFTLTDQLTKKSAQPVSDYLRTAVVKESYQFNSDNFEGSVWKDTHIGVSIIPTSHDISEILEPQDSASTDAYHSQLEGKSVEAVLNSDKTTNSESAFEDLLNFDDNSEKAFTKSLPATSVGSHVKLSSSDAEQSVQITKDRSVPISKKSISDTSPVQRTFVEEKWPAPRTNKVAYIVKELPKPVPTQRASLLSHQASPLSPQLPKSPRSPKSPVFKLKKRRSFKLKSVSKVKETEQAGDNCSDSADTDIDEVFHAACKQLVCDDLRDNNSDIVVKENTQQTHQIGKLKVEPGVQSETIKAEQTPQSVSVKAETTVPKVQLGKIKAERGVHSETITAERTAQSGNLKTESTFPKVIVKTKPKVPARTVKAEPLGQCETIKAEYVAQSVSLKPESTVPKVKIGKVKAELAVQCKTIEAEKIVQIGNLRSESKVPIVIGTEEKVQIDDESGVKHSSEGKGIPIHKTDRRKEQSSSLVISLSGEANLIGTSNSQLIEPIRTTNIPPVKAKSKTDGVELESNTHSTDQSSSTDNLVCVDLTPKKEFIENLEILQQTHVSAQKDLSDVLDQKEIITIVSTGSNAKFQGHNDTIECDVKILHVTTFDKPNLDSKLTLPSVLICSDSDEHTSVNESTHQPSRKLSSSTESSSDSDVEQKTVFENIVNECPATNVNERRLTDLDRNQSSVKEEQHSHLEVNQPVLDDSACDCFDELHEQREEIINSELSPVTERRGEKHLRNSRKGDLGYFTLTEGAVTFSSSVGSPIDDNSLYTKRDLFSGDAKADTDSVFSESFSFDQLSHSDFDLANDSGKDSPPPLPSTSPPPLLDDDPVPSSSLRPLPNDSPHLEGNLHDTHQSLVVNMAQTSSLMHSANMPTPDSEDDIIPVNQTILPYYPADFTVVKEPQEAGIPKQDLRQKLTSLSSQMFYSNKDEHRTISHSRSDTHNNNVEKFEGCEELVTPQRAMDSKEALLDNVVNTMNKLETRSAPPNNAENRNGESRDGYEQPQVPEEVILSAFHTNKNASLVDNTHDTMSDIELPSRKLSTSPGSSSDSNLSDSDCDSDNGSEKMGSYSFEEEMPCDRSILPTVATIAESNVVINEVQLVSHANVAEFEMEAVEGPPPLPLTKPPSVLESHDDFKKLHDSVKISADIDHKHRSESFPAIDKGHDVQTIKHDHHQVSDEPRVQAIHGKVDERSVIKSRAQTEPRSTESPAHKDHHAHVEGSYTQRRPKIPSPRKPEDQDKGHDASSSKSWHAKKGYAKAEVDTGSISQTDRTIQQWEHRVTCESEKDHYYEEEEEDSQSSYSESDDESSDDREYADEHQSPQKVNLYSDNIIQEGETTDAVNRESIGNLSTTRKQWEQVFQQNSKPVSSESKPVMSESKVRHWEVKIPKYSTHHPESDHEPAMDYNNSADVSGNESVVEKEIRLAMQREEMIRRERKASQREMEKLYHNNNTNDEYQKDVTSSENYESPVVDFRKNIKMFDKHYHEMTEADRDSQVPHMLPRMYQSEGASARKMDVVVQPEWLDKTAVKEVEYAEERKSLVRFEESQPSDSTSEASSSSEEEGEDQRFANESIIDREIRLQAEREAALAQERGKVCQIPQEAVVEHPPEVIRVQGHLQEYHHSVTSAHTPARVGTESSSESERSSEIDMNQHQTSSAAHNGEDLIAKELREMREREDDLNRQRQRVFKQDPVHNPIVSHADEPPDVYIPNRHRHASDDSVSSSQSSRASSNDVNNIRERMGNVHIRLSEEPAYSNKDYDSDANKPTQLETPIEREIRVAKERESELRRAKGLPEKDAYDGESPAILNSPARNVTSPTYSPSTNESGTLRRLANSRLQHEMSQERQREATLRKEGHIVSTSDDHSNQKPMKYRDHVDSIVPVSGPVKRNFQLPGKKRLSGSHNNNSEELSTSAKENGVNGMTSSQNPPKTQATTSGGRRVSGSAAAFSFRETRQTAESTIERELREMREREEELKRVRGNAGLVTPHSEKSPRSDSNNPAQEQEYNTMPKRTSSVAAQWEQRSVNS